MPPMQTGDLVQALDRTRISGTLRLTMTRQAYEAVVRPVLPAFAAAHPVATVEVMIDYAYRDIVADRFDAGIRLGEKVERDMIVRKVGPDFSMAIVAAPSYLAGADPLRVYVLMVALCQFHLSNEALAKLRSDLSQGHCISACRCVLV